MLGEPCGAEKGGGVGTYALFINHIKVAALVRRWGVMVVRQWQWQPRSGTAQLPLISASPVAKRSVAYAL